MHQYISQSLVLHIQPRPPIHPDCVYIKHYGFPADIDAYGKEKLRTATITQENQQRSKCLTGEAEIACRAKRDENIELEIKRIKEKNIAKEDQKRNEDQARVDQLCSLAKLASSEENVAQCTLEHFDKSNAPALKALN